MNNYKPKKQFGQNFLTDTNIIKKIIANSKLNEQDIILEIGPGKGALTKILLKRVNQVLAIELDKDLFDYLNQQNLKNLLLIQGDCLKKDWKFQNIIPNKLIANIPYNITSQIIFKMLTYYSQFDEIILMMQFEVGERILASHNSKIYGLLSPILQHFYAIEKIMKIPPHLFNPKPKVDSVVLKFTPKFADIDKSELKNFVEFVKFCFNERRKILFNRLLKKYNIDLKSFFNENNLDLKSRPENISIKNFWKMFKYLHLSC